jgi:DNA-binding LacI/PurR family transcriptional regulator
LSRSAVSRVMNEQPGLRPATIERVRRAMDETGFTPNAHAVHLRGKPSALIGVCVENFITPSGVAKLSELQELLAARGYTALIEVDRHGGGQKVVQHFLSLRVQAVVFIGHFDPALLGERIAGLRRHGVAHVVVDHSGCASASTVTLDRAAAMEQVVGHLHGLGHRRFGVLGVSGAFQTVVDRLDGLRAAFARRKLDFDTCVQSRDAHHVRNAHFAYGRTLARDFAARPDRPTAFIAVNDETAIGALLEFQALGLRVPDDVSIVGFNNQNICEMTQPLLTSVDQQIEATMRAATDLIMGALERGTTPRSRIKLITPLLVVRGSTGRAPRE